MDGAWSFAFCEITLTRRVLGCPGHNFPTVSSVHLILNLKRRPQCQGSGTLLKDSWRAHAVMTVPWVSCQDQSFGGFAYAKYGPAVAGCGRGGQYLLNCGSDPDRPTQGLATDPEQCCRLG